ASELLEDPQVLANDYIREVTSASGTTFHMVASPLQFNEQPPDLTRAPDHGEHTDQVLEELGLDMDAILDLKLKGAVLRSGQRRRQSIRVPDEKRSWPSARVA